MRGIELRAALGRDGIDDGRPVIGLVVPHEVGPPIVPRAPRLTDLIVPARSPSDRVDVGVRTDFAPVEETGVFIYRDPIRVAMTHRVDLGPSLRHAFREEVSIRDRVRAVRLRVDANDLAAEIVRVRRRLLRVPWHPTGSLVDRRIPAGERIGVVAGGQVQVAGTVEGNRPPGVTARETLRGDLEDHLL